MSFLDKAALVTGAGSGIGRATAIALAARGARLVLIDRDSSGLAESVSLIGATGPEPLAIEADVTDATQVGRAVEEATSRFGRLDFAVNNAGILGPQKKVAELTLDEVRSVFDVNVFGVFSCMKAELEVMLPAQCGAIVNVASVAGLLGARRQSAYVASKHAVMGFTKAAAVDCARSGVRINAVCPGLVPTPLAQVLVESSGEDAAARAHPLGRLGQPPEITEAIVWLLSGSASFVTGSAITVDGGFSVT